MPISAKTRKILWARSGNQCAICRCPLVMASGDSDPHAVVGDECHIVSKSRSGPRASEPLSCDLDGYDNLILLCCTHHKLIDDQPNRFTASVLRAIKECHETWVEVLLGLGGISASSQAAPTLDGITLLPRIKSGSDLVRILRGLEMFNFGNDEPKDEEEAEVIGGFLQTLQDLGDILDDLDVGEVVRVEFSLKQDLENLTQRGLLVFGERSRRPIPSHSGLWEVASVFVVREGSRSVVGIGRPDQVEEEVKERST